MSKITIGQIGVGYWGPNLLRNLVANENCEVKTIVDLSIDRRNYVKELYPKINTSDSVDDILLDSEIDAIIISTPVHTHFDFAFRALENKKHILVEKPMAKKSSEVQTLKQLAQENNLVAMVGHTFLFNSAVRYIKKKIDDGSLGDLRYIYCQRLNLGRIRNDVDALWNFAPHDISIIQYWLNDISPIRAYRNGVDYIQDGIEDVTFLNVLYPNKIMANIHVSWLDPHKVRKITIVGSKKMVVYDDIAEKKVAIFDKGIDLLANLGEKMDYDEPSNLEVNYRSGETVYPKIDWKEPLKVEVEHFISCIKGTEKCITGPDHALKVVNILEGLI